MIPVKFSTPPSSSSLWLMERSRAASLSSFWRHSCKDGRKLPCSKHWRQRIGYKGSSFNWIFQRFLWQGGNFTCCNGISIYGVNLRMTSYFILKNTGLDILSMANAGPNTDGYQFFIWTAKTELDGKHRFWKGKGQYEHHGSHGAFGVQNGKNSMKVNIADCSQL